jgi:hypothetical protein
MPYDYASDISYRNHSERHDLFEPFHKNYNKGQLILPAESMTGYSCLGLPGLYDEDFNQNHYASGTGNLFLHLSHEATPIVTEVAPDKILQEYSRYFETIVPVDTGDEQYETLTSEYMVYFNKIMPVDWLLEKRLLIPAKTTIPATFYGGAHKDSDTSGIMYGNPLRAYEYNHRTLTGKMPHGHPILIWNTSYRRSINENENYKIAKLRALWKQFQSKYLVGDVRPVPLPDHGLRSKFWGGNIELS